MRFLQFTLLLAITVIATCAHRQRVPVKEHPNFGPKIEDPELQVIVKEYFKLSAEYNIKFNKNVTIGFSKIDRSNVIGTCSYRPNFREVDIDKEYWENTTGSSKVALVYHELTHCYCERPHDYGTGTEYEDNSLRWIFHKFVSSKLFTPLRPSGFLEDMCPESIMYPIILSDECFKKHYRHYVQEMFVRCQPY